MSEYRMRVYEAGEKLWQTHVIHAQDDAEAKTKAQQRYEELAKELREQKMPAIDRFVLYDGDRPVLERREGVG
jgi:hypothetical protein